MKKNKIIALILSVLMLASCIPVVASAGTADTGNGIVIGDKTYADGTTLVSMDTILKYDLSATAEGTTVAEGVEFTDIQVNASEVTYGTYSETNSTYETAVQSVKNGNMPIGANGGACYTLTSGGNVYQKVGTNTNLPLNENTKYTIHLEVKISELAYNMNVKSSVKNFFGFEFFAETTANRAPTGNGPSRGIMVELDTSLRSPGQTDFLVSGDCANTGISEYFDTDTSINYVDTIWDTTRYIPFDIEIDGRTIRVYADGVCHFDYTFLDEVTYTDTLGLYMVGRIGCYIKSPAMPMFYTKNFNVKAGNVAGKDSVEFKGTDGKTIEVKNVDNGSIIESFPEVTASEGKAIKWYYEGTDVLATAPYTVNGDAVIEAREVDTATFTAVAGAQYTKPTDQNKQNVRFLAVLDTTAGSAAGFEIYAKYNGETGVETKTWDIADTTTTTVYTGINATNPSGTVDSVSAEALGGTFVIAIDVKDAPTNEGQIDFYVRSFIEIDGVKQYGELVTFTFDSGAPSNAELLGAE